MKLAGFRSTVFNIAFIIVYYFRGSILHYWLKTPPLLYFYAEQSLGLMYKFPSAPSDGLLVPQNYVDVHDVLCCHLVAPIGNHKT